MLLLSLLLLVVVLNIKAYKLGSQSLLIRNKCMIKQMKVTILNRNCPKKNFLETAKSIKMKFNTKVFRIFVNKEFDMNSGKKLA